MAPGIALPRTVSSKAAAHTIKAMTSGKPRVVVDIVSDMVCPWCCMGKKRLEKAVTAYKDRLDIEVHSLPFFLDPYASEDGINKVEMYNQKFGAARFAQMLPPVKAAFASEGLSYSTGGKFGSSRNAHRLLTWTDTRHGPELQSKLAEEIFKGYHTQEKFINDKDFLLSACKSVGLDEAAAAKVLGGGDPEIEQLLQQRLTKHKGVNGVPHFVINNKYTVGGAQPPEAFEELFERILLSEAAAAT